MLVYIILGLLVSAVPSFIGYLMYRKYLETVSRIVDKHGPESVALIKAVAVPPPVRRVASPKPSLRLGKGR